MEKCQYILERDLPSPATAEELAHVQNACSQRGLVVWGFSAKDFMATESVPEYELRGALMRHIRDGKRVFHKFNDDGSGQLLDKDVQANVTLSGGSEIYIEVFIEDDSMIQINAHKHRPGKRLLPQIFPSI